MSQASVNPSSDWSIGKKFGFYFLFSYYFLYAFPQVFDGVLTVVDVVLEQYYNLQDKLVSVIGESVFKLGYHEPNYNSGSGDQFFHYIRLLVLVSLAFIAALVWLILGRKYGSHNKLLQILIIYLRYFLGVVLLSYGIGKVIPTQMPPLSPIQLTQDYGDFSPMGIAWTFMSSSPAFQIITGLLEVGAALLLFFRRTSTLGALLSVVVLAGVVAFNFCYDIPVKINSSNYLLVALLLLLFDRNKFLPLIGYYPRQTDNSETNFFKNKKIWIVSRLFKYAYILYISYFFISDTLQFYQKGIMDRVEHPLYGVYDVTSFVKNKQDLPLIKGDKSLWNKVVVSYPNQFTIRDMNDDVQRFLLVRLDSVTHQFDIITSAKDTSRFYYNKFQSNQLKLRGVLKGDTIEIKATHIPKDSFLIYNRGFHWVNEKPFNK
jgi:hypothetical protein